MAQFRLYSPSGPQLITLAGRPAWLLDRLVEAGPGGLTAHDLPAGLRLAGYVHKLRRAGIPIRTEYEANTNDAFGGSHGRYTLEAKVSLIEEGAA